MAICCIVVRMAMSTVSILAMKTLQCNSMAMSTVSTVQCTLMNTMVAVCLKTKENKTLYTHLLAACVSVLHTGFYM